MKPRKARGGGLDAAAILRQKMDFVAIAAAAGLDQAGMRCLIRAGSAALPVEYAGAGFAELGRKRESGRASVRITRPISIRCAPLIRPIAIW